MEIPGNREPNCLAANVEVFCREGPSNQCEAPRAHRSLTKAHFHLGRHPHRHYRRYHIHHWQHPSLVLLLSLGFDDTMHELLYIQPRTTC